MLTVLLKGCFTGGQPPRMPVKCCILLHPLGDAGVFRLQEAPLNETCSTVLEL